MPWIIGGAMLGAAALGSQGSKKGTVDTSGSNTPWFGVQPNLLELFQRAQGLSQGQSITPQSPYTQQAIGQMAGQAGDPNSLIGQSQRQLGKTINGDYLTTEGNPAMQAAIDAAKRTVNSQFSGDNYGGSAHQEWLARGAAGAAAPLLGQERQNQLNALQLAPGLQGANTNLLGQAGAMQEQRGQAEIQAPWQNLFNYQQALSSGTPYGTQTGQSPYFTNPLASALGMGIGGLGIYNAFGRGGGGNGSNYTSDGTFSPQYTGFGMQGDYQYG